MGAYRDENESLRGQIEQLRSELREGCREHHVEELRALHAELMAVEARIEAERARFTELRERFDTLAVAISEGAMLLRPARRTNWVAIGVAAVLALIAMSGLVLVLLVGSAFVTRTAVSTFTQPRYEAAPPSRPSAPVR